jgi:hypothetical protein
MTDIRATILNKPFPDAALAVNKLGIILHASVVDGVEVEEDGQRILNRLNVEVKDDLVVAVKGIG